MKRILTDGRSVVRLDTVGSTQTELRALLRAGRTDVGAVLAAEQTEGRGRHGRKWVSPKGTCLAVSLALFDYADWPKPEFVGMAAGLAVAEALDLLLQWPNDLLVELGRTFPSSESASRLAHSQTNLRKVGGVLTELVPTGAGLVPLVGIGVNLMPGSFPPEVARIAATVFEAQGRVVKPEEAMDRVLAALEALPEPGSWADLRERWMARDRTEGKGYKLPDGRVCVACGIGDDGRLIGDIGHERLEVPSAQALF